MRAAQPLLGAERDDRGSAICSAMAPTPRSRSDIAARHHAGDAGIGGIYARA